MRSMSGGSALAIWDICCCIAWGLPRPRAPPAPGILMPFILPIILPKRLCSSSRVIISDGKRPAPRQTRSMRLTLKILEALGASSSASVIESINTIIDFMRFVPCSSPPLGIMSAIPGTMLMMDEMGPMFCKF